MGQALLLGSAAASALIVGAVVALVHPIGPRPLGLVMAFGSGLLISSIAYELVSEAFTSSAGEGGVGLGLVGGALAFFAGDAAIDRLGGERRKDAGGDQASGRPMAIVLGTVLDGVPESIVLGLGVASGEPGSFAMLVAVFVSNLPEAMASTTGLRLAGWPPARLVTLWVVITVVSGVAAAVGFTASASASPRALAIVLSFAGGALLTMLADTMMPEAYEHGGRLTGVITTIGFGIGFAISTVA